MSLIIRPRPNAQATMGSVNFAVQFSTLSLKRKGHPPIPIGPSDASALAQVLVPSLQRPDYSATALKASDIRIVHHISEDVL